MRVAAIYDIHANLPALEAVIREIRQAEVDQIVVGGDVLPGPMPGSPSPRILGLRPILGPAPALCYERRHMVFRANP